MARRLTEEQVAKSIIRWLVRNGWTIIAFDFPQSGTGKVLHPSNTTSKTDGAIIPDIIAYKNGIVVDFENKDRYVQSDFEKVSFMKNTTIYDRSFSTLLKGYAYTKIYYGIGMPYSDAFFTKSEENKHLVDFITFVNEDNSIKIIDNIGDIF